MPAQASYSAPAASYSAPAASASSGAGLENLAAWISTNYMGMGKSAMDALPELRRKGITPAGNNFSFNGQILDAAGIAQALRLQVGATALPQKAMLPQLWLPTESGLQFQSIPVVTKVLCTLLPLAPGAWASD